MAAAAGCWSCGVMRTLRRYTYCNGSMYVGQFLGGTAHGLGVFVNAAGERYVGEWAGDKFHGNGIYKFQGGSTFAVRTRNCFCRPKLQPHSQLARQGSWKFGKMDGHGVYTNVQGTKCVRQPARRCAAALFHDAAGIWASTRGSS
jgi:hypothetical protein